MLQFLRLIDVSTEKGRSFTVTGEGLARGGRCCWPPHAPPADNRVLTTCARRTARARPGYSPLHWDRQTAPVDGLCRNRAAVFQLHFAMAQDRHRAATTDAGSPPTPAGGKFAEGLLPWCRHVLIRVQSKLRILQRGVAFRSRVVKTAPMRPALLVAGNIGRGIPAPLTMCPLQARPLPERQSLVHSRRGPALRGKGRVFRFRRRSEM